MDCECCGQPLPDTAPDANMMAMQVSESVRVYWETRDWTAAQFRRALVKERLR